MKQSTFSAVMANSIKNLLQGYTKGIRFVAVLMVLLTMGIGQVWGGSIVLTYSDFGYNSTTYSSKTITKSNVSFTCDNGANNSSRLALKAGASLYNTTALPGKITSIVIENVAFSSSSNAGFYVYGSTTKQGTTTTLLNNTGTTGKITINFSSYNYKYFYIKNKTSRALYNTKITINYEDAETSIYLNPGVWNADAAKYAIYYFSGNTTGWSSLMTKVNDCEEIYTTKIPQLSNMTIIPVRLSNDATSGNWDNKWNQTENITFNSNYDFIQITNWGSSDNNCPYTYNSKYTSKTFTITFKGNNNTGGTMSQVTGITCEGSKELPANAFTRTGYNFNGWNTNANGTGTPYDDGETIYNITSDITLYAQWEIGTYTITLDANGGSGHTTRVTATYNSATLSPSTITNPTKTGYTFKGWYSGSGGTGSMVIGIDGKLQANVSGYTGANGVWTATSAETLYAQWQILSYTVTWVVDGDETEETVNHGETVVKAPNIAPNNLPCGQKFAGWTDKPITGTTDNIPDPLYKTAAEIPAIKKAETFYAVFADYEE